MQRKIILIIIIGVWANLKVFLTGSHLQVYELLFLISVTILCTCYTLISLGVMIGIPNIVQMWPVSLSNNYNNKWYQYQPEIVVENGSYKILWDFSVSTDHVIEAHWRSNLNVKENSKCQIVDSDWTPKKLKRLKNTNALARELKKIWNNCWRNFCRNGCI